MRVPCEITDIARGIIIYMIYSMLLWLLEVKQKYETLIDDKKVFHTISNCQHELVKK